MQFLDYIITVAKVKTDDILSDNIPINIGVLQGDTLAPYLFIIALDYVLRKSFTNHDGYQLSRGLYCNELVYADDIALTQSDYIRAQNTLNQLCTHARSVGLLINIAKTEYMEIGDWSHDCEDRQLYIQYGDIASNIKKVQEFKYLGSILTTDNNCYKDFLHRKSLAWYALNNCKKLWKSNIDNKDKVYFFRCIVETILLYGAVTWTMNKSFVAELNSTYHVMLRHILNIQWSDHIKNETIRNTYQLDKISDLLAWHRIKFYGICYLSLKGNGTVSSQLEYLRRYQPVHDLLLYTPWRAGKFNSGAKGSQTYVAQLINDSLLNQFDDNSSPKYEFLISICNKLKDKATWYELCQIYCKTFCNFTFKHKEAQKKKKDKR